MFEILCRVVQSCAESNCMFQSLQGVKFFGFLKTTESPIPYKRRWKMTRTKRTTKQSMVTRTIRLVSKPTKFLNKCQIYKIEESPYFYYSFRIKGGKNIRKSTNFRDIKSSEEYARSEFLKYEKLCSDGHEFKGISCKKLIEEYLISDKKRVNSGQLAFGSWENRKHILEKRLLPFLNRNTHPKGNRLLEDVSGLEFEKYFEYRRNNAKKGDIKTTTLRSEKSIIGTLFKYAYNRGYISDRQRPSFERLKYEIGVRAGFTDDEYKRLYSYLNRGFINKEDEERVVFAKEQFRDYLYILANSGIRTSELNRLENRHIQVYPKRPNQRFPYAIFNIPPSISKVNYDRNAVCTRGDIVKRVMKRTSDKLGGNSPENKLLVTTEGYPFTKSHVYGWWKKIRGVVNLEHRIVYDLRGYYISKRLEEGMEIGQVARTVGTSINQIHFAYYGRTLDIDSATKVTRKTNP